MAEAAANYVSFEGYLKNVEGELEKSVPSFAELQKRHPFLSAKKLGKKYVFPVMLRREHGVTFGYAGNVRGKIYTLNDPVSAETQEAEVDGAEITVQGDISYGLLASAQEAGEGSYGDIFDDIVFGLREAAQFQLETMMLHGKRHIGIIGTTPDQSGTAHSYTITAATWAAGLWIGMENAYIDVYDTTGATKRNATTTIQVTGVDPDTRTIYVTGTEAEMDTIVATDIVVPRGWFGATTSTVNCFSGLIPIATNTGTLFGIDASVATGYNLWRGNTKALGSVKLTMAAILQAHAKTAVRGNRRKNAICMVNEFAWIDVMNDTAALRQFVQETKSEMAMGTHSLKFHSVNGATLELVPHSLMFAGEALLYCPETVKRIGATDITMRFKNAKGQAEAFYQELETKNGVRMRAFAEQAIINTMPATMCHITGIVPESLA